MAAIKEKDFIYDKLSMMCKDLKEKRRFKRISYKRGLLLTWQKGACKFTTPNILFKF